jgi:hypothetical protein
MYNTPGASVVKTASRYRRSERRHLSEERHVHAGLKEIQAERIAQQQGLRFSSWPGG